MNPNQINILTNEAVKFIQGKFLKIGCICAHPSDEYKYILKEIRGEIAVLEKNGTQKEFPLSECFDVSLLFDLLRAMAILLDDINKITDSLKKSQEVKEEKIEEKEFEGVISFPA